MNTRSIVIFVMQFCACVAPFQGGHASVAPSNAPPRPMIEELGRALALAEPTAYVSRAEATSVTPDLTVVQHVASRRGFECDSGARVRIRQDVLHRDAGSWRHEVRAELTVDITGEQMIFERAVEVGIGAQESAWRVEDTSWVQLDATFAKAWPALIAGQGPEGVLAWLEDAQAVDSTAATLARRLVSTHHGAETAVVVSPEADWGQALALHAPGVTERPSTSTGSVQGAQPSETFLGWDCWYECFSAISTPMSVVDMLCLGIGLAACTVSGPGFPVCASGVFAGCGVVAALGEIVAAATCVIAC